MKEATELTARGNRHIRIVKVPGHCLKSEPQPVRDYDYCASRHELAGLQTPHTTSTPTLLTLTRR